ncbi:uncharacterized protein LOC126380614 [Pectinophora gossypiella]|uniref:uncharacterized protein LOC126380614 n=1 Tax=Pectinophora gossypiella TaxID=13191 RepID=UPI00214F3182|nr:uncharacterized protein LOC126380614 [Pectinophora gossypiella]
MKKSRMSTPIPPKGSQLSRSLVNDPGSNVSPAPGILRQSSELPRLIELPPPTATYRLRRGDEGPPPPPRRTPIESEPLPNPEPRRGPSKGGPYKKTKPILKPTPSKPLPTKPIPTELLPTKAPQATPTDTPASVAVTDADDNGRT